MVILNVASCAGKTTIAMGVRDQRVVVASLWVSHGGGELAQVEREVLDAAPAV